MKNFEVVQKKIAICKLRFAMDPNGVRFIPNVFDRLFYYNAPADAIVCQITHQTFDLIACQQVRNRLAVPKKQMLMMVWPICMQTREDNSHFYKQVDFYDILRANVMRSSGWPAFYFADLKMGEFLDGFSSFMLDCVLSNARLYTNLKVLMLEINNDNDLYTHYHIESTKHAAEAERLALVVNTVVARCASSTLRHFVFRSSSYQMPEEFHTRFKLDCILAQMQQLETLYMPFLTEYEHAHDSLKVQRPSWQALHDLPVENRWPNLRRIVLNTSGCTGNDVSAILAVLNNTNSPRLTKCELPDFHHCSSSSSKLVIEVVSKFPIEHLGAKLPAESDDKCFVIRDVKKLTRSHDIIAANVKGCDNTPGDTRQFAKAIDKALTDTAAYRLQSLSVVNDLLYHCDGPQTCKLLSARLNLDEMRTFAPETVVSLLDTLSCHLSQPIQLTLQLDWYGLVKHLALFTTSSTTTHWTTCFPRGVLKLEMTITNGLQYYNARSGSSFWNCIKNHDFDQNLPTDHSASYTFPPCVVIQFCPRVLQIKHDYDAAEYDHMPLIRKHFTDCVRQFVSDIVGDPPNAVLNTERVEIASTVKAARTLRNYLYASCQKLVIILDILYRCTCSEYEKNGSCCHNRPVEEMAYDKKFERELAQMFCKSTATAENEGPQFIMPNLKSISVGRKLTEDYY